MSKRLILILFLSLFFTALAKWLVLTYGDQLSVEQILFHLQIGFAANTGTDYELIKGFARKCIAIPILLTLAISLCISFVVKRWQHSLTYFKNLIFIAFLLSLTFLAQKINFWSYLISSSGQDTFTATYEDPSNIKISTPRAKKNLILIYVESLENNLSKINRNILRPLIDLPGIHVPKFTQAPGTGWSIAGMVASQCALPVKGYLGNNLGNAGYPDFLPSAVCLGDVLNSHGYKQTFLVGPDLKFAGMDKFYQAHKYDVLIGRDEIFNQYVMDKSLFTAWGEGPHDDTLLEVAYKIAISDAKSGRPFNLTIITTDNHAPQGTPSPRCKDLDNHNDYLTTFSCNSHFVAEFVHKIIKNPIFKNTELVVMGDHLFMANEDQSTALGADRTVFFKYINPSKLKPSRIHMTHFDVAPSILDSLGYMEGTNHRFGLGVSVFAPTHNYDEIYNSNMSQSILNSSSVYDKLWNSKSQNLNGSK